MTSAPARLANDSAAGAAKPREPGDFKGLRTLGTLAANRPSMKSQTIRRKGIRLGAVAVAALALLTGLAPGRALAGPNRFERWVTGRIDSVDAGRQALVLRADQKDMPDTYGWDRNSRCWPVGGSKDGQPLAAGVFKVGDPVRIQFRKRDPGEPVLILKLLPLAIPD